MPCSASRAAVFGPIPGIRPGGEPPKRSHACSRVRTTKPFGFSASEATFATSFDGPMPIEHAKPRLGRDRRLHPPRGRLGPLEAGQVEIGLVEADDLHSLDLLAQHVA